MLTSSFKLNAKCNNKYQLFFFIVLKFNLHIIAEVKNLTIAPYHNMQKHKVDNVQTYQTNAQIVTNFDHFNSMDNV